MDGRDKAAEGMHHSVPDWNAMALQHEPCIALLIYLEEDAEQRCLSH